MNKLLLSILLLAMFSGPSFAEPHDEEHTETHPIEEQERDHEDDDDHEEGELELSNEAIEKADITLANAGPADLTLTARLFGKTQPDPQQLSHVKARFPGLILSVSPSLGDMNIINNNTNDFINAIFK